MANIGIKIKNKNNLSDALFYYLQNEQIDYEIIDDSKTYEKVILVGLSREEIIYNLKSEAIIISDNEEFIQDNKYIVNYIVTNLVNDDTNYSEVQKEYLFKKGIYSVFIQKVDELLKNDNEYDGMIYNLTKMKTQPYNWIFKFESINETYAWLTKMNRSTSPDFTDIKVNFYSEKIYDDSVKEINYLSDIIMNVKNKKNLVDIFILNDEEYNILKQNYFFKSLVNNISDNYTIYLVDKDEIMKNDLDVYNKLLDGIIVYEHCVYRDTYDDEYSLGIVDCKQETVAEYSKYLTYVIEKYGKKMRREVDSNV